MNATETPSNVMVLYKVVRKMKSDTKNFRFQLSSDLLGQEMDCIIDVDDIMQFATMKEISANRIPVYIK